jgi:hypothetical protein
MSESEFEFATPEPVRLQIRVPGGDVLVTTVEGENSTITLEGAEKLLEATRVELIGDRLVIEQRRRSVIGLFDRWGDPIRVTADVPSGSSVELATAAGDAILKGRLGTLVMKSASGNLTATGQVEGDARVELVSGDVRLPRIAGDLTGRTVSGDVEVDAVEGSVSVQSVSGDVRVGSVREGSVNVRSVSGNVELGIASGTSVDVDAGSASGELSSEVPLSETPDATPGPRVVIRGNTVSGDFRLVRAA